MIYKFIQLICVFILIFIVFLLSLSTSDVNELSADFLGKDNNFLTRPAARRSLLSYKKNEHETALVAALDGKIHLVEPKSGEVFWSFASGPSIYSSYQAPAEHDNENENSSRIGSFFIDCGDDDWALYMHDEFGKRKLKEGIQDFISNTPLIAEDGGVVLGSKKTTVFLIDAKTGRLIYTYGLSDSPPNSQNDGESNVVDPVNLKPDELPLYITRTDYSLKSYVLNTNKELWNLTVSEIGAAFLCQGIVDPFNDVLLEREYDLPSQTDLPFNMPLSCRSKAVVYRFRNPITLLDSNNVNMLEGLKRTYMMLPASENNNDRLTLQPEADNSEFSYKDGLPVPAPNPFPPFLPKIDQLSDIHQSKNIDLVPALIRTNENLEPSGMQNVTTHSYVLFGTICVGMMVFLSLRVREKVDNNNQASSLNGNAKKRKPRKSRKNIVKETTTSSDSGNESYDNNKPWLKLNQSMIDYDGGRTIGKLFVSNKEIAKGSNGTIVLEGIYEGRSVAVKRLVKAHHDVAFKEIQNLIASDRHPNVVRWYGVESDQDFVYLSLERCSCSLGDLIEMCSGSENTPNVKYEVQLDSFRDIIQDVKLWKENGYPSPLLLKLMRDVVSGVMHLHELGIVHRDLKPQNVLIIKEKNLCAKLSDMGISKLLAANMSSLGLHATGYGSSGWQAPEQLLNERQTRAVDMFSLGCVLFYCLTGGKHPFGDHLERDINVVKNKTDLFLVECIPEAMDLFSCLLDPKCDVRPKASEVFNHPLFWDSELRLSFLRDTSDRVELEDRETHSDLLSDLESTAPLALVTKWDEKMEPAFLNNIGRYRRYKFNSVRDLLRVIRNKLNHYRELPLEIQEILGSIPEGFDHYFASRFPKLLIESYKVMYKYCKEEETFCKYFKGNNGV